MVADKPPTEIGRDAAEKDWGIYNRHERMPNGELRFRLMQATGSGYILTVSSGSAGWQKSHWHQETTEIYVVEEGWIGFASLTPPSSTPSLSVHLPGDILTTHPKIPHNVFMPANTKVHTIKIAQGNTKNDWHGCADLDEMIELLDEINYFFPNFLELQG